MAINVCKFEELLNLLTKKQLFYVSKKAWKSDVMEISCVNVLDDSLYWNCSKEMEGTVPLFNI